MSRHTHTHTYVTLEVSTSAYDEIAAKLRAADYGHCFNSAGEIDMTGIAMVRMSTCGDLGPWGHPCDKEKGHDRNHVALGTIDRPTLFWTEADKTPEMMQRIHHGDLYETGYGRSPHLQAQAAKQPEANTMKEILDSEIRGVKW